MSVLGGDSSGFFGAKKRAAAGQLMRKDVA